ncbi:TPA: EamA family transporter [Pyrococcus horikoshii]|uniref:EamA family transporter n=1 Tax=Pyrococcus horikoshii TaxID=53953 RepID=A0A832SWQ6_PYRHR|nr:EamA family transporter [Pyrococcus horikoshii]
MMQAYLIYAVLAAFFASLVPIFGKIGLKDVDPTMATTIRAIIMAIFLVTVTFFVKPKMSGINRYSILFITLSGVSGALSWLFYFMAIKNGRVPAVVAIDKTSVALAIFLSWLVLGSEMNIKTVIGALLIVLGAILVSL